MKKARVRKTFIEEVRKHGIVQIACDKSGISRQTFYRWLNEDIDFRIIANEAIDHGEATVNDVAESNVLRGIQNQDKDYTKYWLSLRHPKFKRSARVRTPNIVRYDPAKFEAMAKLWFGDYDDGDEAVGEQIETEIKEKPPGEVASEIK